MNLNPFRGSTYEHEHDYERLSNNLQRVFVCMKDGEWYTAKELRPVGGLGWSRRIRDLRGLAWGPLIVQCERLDGGLWQYRIEPDSITPHIVYKIMERKPDKEHEEGSRTKDDDLDLDTTQGRAEQLIRRLGIRVTDKRVFTVENAFRAEQRLGFEVGVKRRLQ